MITFSATPKLSGTSHRKVPDLIKKVDTKYWGEAYVKLAETGIFCTMKTFKSFEAFAYAKEESIICSIDDEMISSSFQVTYEFEQVVHSDIDSAYWVDEFLEQREKIFFEAGKDIWRMFKLTCMGDVIATKKFRTVIDEYNLKELITELITTPGAMSQLYEILR